MNGDREHEPGPLDPAGTVAFSELVLDQLPTPIVVVDLFGTIVYGNAQMASTMGLTLDVARGRNITEFIHPDDMGWALDAFLALSEAGRAQTDRAAEPWAAVPMRIVDDGGRAMSMEITGAHGLRDQVIDGFIYEVRHGGEHHVLRQVLTGLAAGHPIDALLQLVAEMVAAPPVRLQVVIAEVDGDDVRLVGSAGDTVASVLADLDLRRAPWVTATERPEQLEVAELDEPYRAALTAAGIADWMHVATVNEASGPTYRVVALAPYHHVPATGVLQRLARATELIGVIQIRAMNDALLAHAARHDPLTDLPNRLGLAEVLDGASPPSGVLFVDLDGFKPVNDQHGHAAGDHVLRAAAQRLRRAVRPTDVVARVGGDEFIVVLAALAAPDGRSGDATNASPGDADPHQLVEEVARRMLRELSRPVEVNGVEIRVTASIGVAIAPATVDLDVMLASADAAMYAVKRAGGSGHRVSVIELD